MDDLNKRETRIYSTSLKRKVIEEYLNTGVTKISLITKYGIRSKGGIQKWMRDLGYTDIYRKAGYLHSNSIPTLSLKKKKPSPATEQSQDSRIKELERLLEDEQLRSEAYSRMIDIAERDYKISIRKKPSTK
jgi:transposase-like protein